MAVRTRSVPLAAPQYRSASHVDRNPSVRAPDPRSASRSRVAHHTIALVLAEAVLAVALAELVVRQAEQRRGFLLLVARALERILAQPGLERVDPVGQRQPDVV